MSPRKLVRAGEAFTAANLDRDDYPITLIAFYAKDDRAEVVWAVTLIAPPPGAKLLLKVPPLKRWVGRNINMATVPAATALSILENAWS